MHRNYIKTSHRRHLTLKFNFRDEDGDLRDLLDLLSIRYGGKIKRKELRKREIEKKRKEKRYLGDSYA
jgi:uncharacterized membrane protein